jgi:hypothetical protein
VAGVLLSAGRVFVIHYAPGCKEHDPMKWLRALFSPLALGYLLLSPIASYAVTMSDLFQGQTITADDKLFSNFNLVSVVPVNGGIADFTLIDVVPLVDDPLNPGIKFIAPMPPNFVPALGTPFGHTGLSSISVIFEFDVQTTTGLPLIKDNSLLINRWLFDADPQAFIQIDEQVFDAAGNSLGDKRAIVFNGGMPNDPFDRLEFSPQSLVHVRKTINIVGPFDNNGAFLTMFEQRFSQVPEPSGLTLAGAMWLCLWLGGGRRRQ